MNDETPPRDKATEPRTEAGRAYLAEPLHERGYIPLIDNRLRCKACEKPWPCEGAEPRAEGPQPIDADMIAAALEATLKAHDAGIGWRLGSGYDHGDPPSADQIAKGIAARLPI